MKLSREQVEKLSAIILDKLKERDLIVLKAGADVVLARINDAIITDLRAEDSLDKEVEEILKSHSADINSGRVDYRRMFNMIKTKLARERGMVL